LRSRRSRSIAAAPLLTLAGLVGGVLGLFVTNPDPEAFETFAGQRLTTLLHEELCGADGLPLLARLLIRDCPGLVASQSGALGRIALAHSRRRNLGLLSLYRTELGGQSLFGVLEVPRYNATTLGVAGHFVILQSEAASTPEIRR
jgi:hypothetical protein